MKKLFVCVLLGLVILIAPSSLAQEQEDILKITQDAGYTVDPINRPKASIVVDADSSQILWQDHIDDLRDPASMSKMFTLYLLFEDMASGKVSLDTTVTATETDQAISKIYEISNNNIVAGVAYPIKDLIAMTAVPSSNVATIMIANYLSQNNAGAFIDRINQTAKKLKMTNTHFSNASGAAAVSFKGYYKPQGYDPEAPNQTTARDLAILIYHMLDRYPEILQYTNKLVVKTMVGTPYEEEFHSYNHSLPGDEYGIPGIDGLKTGSSPTGAFNAMVTGQRDGHRVITIVMGVGDWSDQNGEFYRHPFINALTEKGFKLLKDQPQARYDHLISEAQVTTDAPPHAHKHKHEHTNHQNTLLDQIDHIFDRYHNYIAIGLVLFVLVALITIWRTLSRR